MATYIPVLILMGLAAAVAVGLFTAGTLLGPKAPNAVKADPFECGNPSDGARNIRPSVKFYLTALLFVVFDIEAVIRNDTLYSAENVAALESRNLKIYRLANGAGVRCAGWMLWSPRANSGIDGGGATVGQARCGLVPAGIACARDEPCCGQGIGRTAGSPLAAAFLICWCVSHHLMSA